MLFWSSTTLSDAYSVDVSLCVCMRLHMCKSNCSWLNFFLFHTYRKKHRHKYIQIEIVFMARDCICLCVINFTLNFWCLFNHIDLNFTRQKKTNNNVNQLVSFNWLDNIQNKNLINSTKCDMCACALHIAIVFTTGVTGQWSSYLIWFCLLAISMNANDSNCFFYQI